MGGRSGEVTSCEAGEGGERWPPQAKVAIEYPPFDLRREMAAKPAATAPAAAPAAAAAASASASASRAELRVTSGAKISALVERALEALPAGAVRLHAEGNAVSKCVSVAEIAKRKLRGVHQLNEIGLADDGARPTVGITLSLRPLDAAHPGYQPPLTDEERAGVRPDFDAADAMETDGAPT